MRDDSCSRGREFESRCRILDGHNIFTLICCKDCIVCLERPKKTKKRLWLAHFLTLIRVGVKILYMKFLVKDYYYSVTMKSTHLITP